MKTHEDPLDIVRESRIRLSRESDNDPKRFVAVLRKQESARDDLASVRV